MYSQLCECVDLIKREAIDWIFDKELLIEDSDDIDIMAIFSPYLKNKERTKKGEKPGQKGIVQEVR